MIATKTRDLRQVSLDLTDGPSMTDVFGTTHPVTAVQITYLDGQPTAIRITGPEGDLFVENIDDEPFWPGWLRALVEEHKPADQPPAATIEVTFAIGAAVVYTNPRTGMQEDGYVYAGPDTSLPTYEAAGLVKLRGTGDKRHIHLHGVNPANVHRA